MERLKELRKSKNLSLLKLAEKVGCSKQYLWNLEKGHNNNPSAKLKEAICKELGVSLYFFSNEIPIESPIIFELRENEIWKLPIIKEKKTNSFTAKIGFKVLTVMEHIDTESKKAILNALNEYFKQ